MNLELFRSVIGRIFTPCLSKKDIHVLIIGTCEYVVIQNKREFKVAKRIKGVNQVTLK